MKKYLLLTAAALMMFGFNPYTTAQANDHDMHAGEELVEHTKEMSAEAEAEFNADVECAEEAMMDLNEEAKAELAAKCTAHANVDHDVEDGHAEEHHDH